MNLKQITKIVAIISLPLAIVIFLTLGNNLVVKNAVVNSLGFLIAVLSLVAFVISLIILVVKKPKRAVEPQKTDIEVKPTKTVSIAPRWYRLTKLSIGLFIIFGALVEFR